jgi:hypothetical protein
LSLPRGNNSPAPDNLMTFLLLLTTFLLLLTTFLLTCSLIQVHHSANFTKYVL